MKKIALHNADGSAITAVELKSRARVILLPPPSVPATATIKGLTNYERGDILRVEPQGDDIALVLVNHQTGKRQALGTAPALDTVPRLLTLHDGRFVSLTVEDTDEEIYSRAKAQADADADKRDKWTALAIVGAIALIICIAWRVNTIGLICLLMCLIAL